jgi:transposase-like protein
MMSYPQQPPAPPPPPAQPASEYVPCPRCGNPYVRRIRYTFWGGYLGPKLLNHVKCDRCGYTYNGKTGRSNTTAIAIYMVILMAAAILLLVMLG